MSEEGSTTSLPHHVHAEELRTISDRRICAGIDEVGLPSVARPLTPVEGDGSISTPRPSRDHVPRPFDEVSGEALHEAPDEDPEDRSEADDAIEGLPSTRRGLVGLGISGGGIRSSTFSLGVIQALARRDLFRQIDYMSTVSGGGYTGSLLSSLLQDRGPNDPFPLDKPRGREEPQALRHLRNGSNYLNPGGLLNTLRLPAVVLRGLLLNTLMIVPVMMLFVVFTEFLHENEFFFLESVTRLTAWFYELVTLDQSLRPTAAAVVQFLLLAGGIGGLYTLLHRSELGAWKSRNRGELGFALLLLLACAFLVAVPIEYLMGRAIAEPFEGLRFLLVENTRIELWVAVASLMAATYFLVHGSKRGSTFRRKVLVYGGSLLAPSIVFGFFLVMLAAQVDSPFLRSNHPELSAPTPDPEAVVADTLVLSKELRIALHTKGLDWPERPSGVTADSSTVVRATFCGSRWHLTTPAFTDSLVVIPNLSACSAPGAEVADSSRGQLIRIDTTKTASKYTYEIWGANLHLGGERAAYALVSDWMFFWVAVVCIVLNLVFLDVNMSSLHGFYRDRLSKLYLFRTPDGKLVPNDDQALHTLSDHGSSAPYHIINATLNLQGETVESTRGRSSDFFIFSKHFSGGPHTGYCDTQRMWQIDPSIDLGTAMAISAAAAAPNMGTGTNRSMVFALTMLNVRLGYWVPNPKWVNALHARQEARKEWSAPRRGVGSVRDVLMRRWIYRPGTRHLVNEALGRLNSNTSLVNVTDGGHLENLGAYELLRRKCRVVILIDGEADPDLRFKGLVTLMRLARIDLGVRIQMEGLHRLEWPTPALRPDGEEVPMPLDKKVTDRHFAVGTIDYGPDGLGCLIYIKSTVTGDETPYVLKYREEHPAFPHQTTADQFFDETQFEAYRSLGHHIGAKVAERVGDWNEFADTLIYAAEDDAPPAEKATSA